jgi:hypothetical protein
MWVYAKATLREALSSPTAWGLLGLAIFFGWCATALAILALVGVEAENRALVESTSQLFGAICCLGLLGKLLDEDRGSGFALAADAAGPGPAGRIVGRWAGAVTAGTVLAMAAAHALAVVGASPGPDSLYLLYTSMSSIALVGAWGVLLGTQWNGVAAGLAVMLLWVLGHLPWGTPPFLTGVPAQVLRGWLPGPRAAGSALLALGYTSAAVGGLLALSAALVRPAEPHQ